MYSIYKMVEMHHADKMRAATYGPGTTILTINYSVT